jgi:hypothetical protein
MEILVKWITHVDSLKVCSPQIIGSCNSHRGLCIMHDPMFSKTVTATFI